MSLQGKRIQQSRTNEQRMVSSRERTRENHSIHEAARNAAADFVEDHGERAGP